MPLTDWLNLWWSPRKPARRRSRHGKSERERAPRAKVAAELLEQRMLPAVITVTSLADTIADDGQVTLREAIQAANTDSVVDGSTKGSGADTIQFAPSLTAGGPASITLGGTQLLIKSDLSINGPGADRLTISGNNASRIFNINDANSANASTVSISGLKLTGGKITRGDLAGGAIRNLENLTLTQAIISGNRADGEGGAGVFNAGSLTVSQSKVQGNTVTESASGAGIWSNGGPTAATTITQSTISGNTTDGYGGGVYNSYGTLVITQSEISGNSAITGAGVISYGGSLNLAQSTISGNTGSGEGVRSSSTTTIEQCTISQNTGPGLYLPYGVVTLAQSTITGNGVGLRVSDLQPVTVRNTIIAGNSIDILGGFPTLQAQNSLVGNPSFASGLINGLNGNIVGNGAGSSIVISTVLNTTLADNGGPAKTHALVSGSPAINAGDNNLIPADTLDRDGDGNTTESDPFDQRGIGFARVRSGTIDLGAVEFASSGPELPVVTVAVSPASVAEDGSGNLIFTLTRDLAVGSLTVNFNLSGDAVSGTDYSATATSSVTFSDGASTATVTVDPTADTTIEANETVVLTVTSGTGYQVGSANNATGTILNDDASLSIVAASASKAEGNSGNTPFTFTVTRDGSTSGSASVNYAVSGSGAVAANVNDFGGNWPSGSINFAAGESSQTLTVNVRGDIAAESDEGFMVTLSNATGASLGTATATGTIQNDDLDSALAIAAKNASRLEGRTVNTAFTFTVTRSGSTSGASSVDFAVTGSGTNTANADDFGGTLPSGTVNFAAGESSKTITVNVSGDATVEPNEGFTVTLSNVVGANLGTASASGTIRNDDASLSITATSASNAEGSGGTTPFTFTVTRTGTISGAASVDYTVAGSGTNAADATDFGGTLPSGTLNFAATETTKTITINVSGDTSIEPDEDFTVTLSNPSGANLGTASALGTIRNDEALPTLSINAVNASRAEWNRGSTPFEFTVSRTGDSSGAASAAFSVTGSGSNPADTADFGGAFPSGSVSFAAGETSQKVVINVTADTAFEASEDFTVTLSNPTGANLGMQSAAQATIQNDDAAPVVASPSTQTFVVDTLVDENDGNFAPGDLSLREAIARANSLAGTQTITFASALTESGPATITLNGSPLVITSSIVVDGPGADRLTIDADHRSRVFKVDDGASTRSQVLLRGLTLTNGTASDGSGGAIYNQESLTVMLSTIRDSSARDSGGGILSSEGDLTVVQSTLSGNAATNFGGSGGAITQIMGTLNIVQSTINGNSASSFGGGVFAVAATVVVSQSTFTGNSSVTYGGAFTDSGCDTTFEQSTVVGNRAGYVGGGIHNGGSGFLTLKNSLIVGNTGGETFKLHDLVTNSVTTLTAVSNLIGSPKIDDPNALGVTIHGVNGNILGTDDGSGGRMLLGAATVVSTVLTDLGGPTLVLPLLSGSLAIDRGSLSAIPADRLDADSDGNITEPAPFDQRGTGFARVTGGSVDLGAVEFGSTNAPGLTSAELANVLLDESGKLWIRDLAAGGRADQLTVSFDAGNQEVVIRDPLNALTASVGTIVDAHEIRVARAAITGNGLRVELNGGADQLDLSGLPAGLLAVEVDGGDGNDTIIGHAGADLILGGRGHDSISSGAGNDTLSGGDGNDTLRGEAGNDVLRGQMHNDRLLGGDGDDTCDGGGGDDNLSGEAGNDSLLGSTGNDLISGGDGRDKLLGGDGRDSLEGDSGNDQLNGGLGNDSADGGAGDDYIEGQAGNDQLNGGSGDDTIEGGLDDDTLLGLAGNDRINGGDGNDLAKGGEGNDTLLGGNGNDNLSGSVGDDVEDGGNGADTVAGGDGNDSLRGGEGNDYIHGDNGLDDLHGDAGDDSLDGGAGNDVISGDVGDDVLIGDENDLLIP